MNGNSLDNGIEGKDIRFLQIKNWNYIKHIYLHYQRLTRMV